MTKTAFETIRELTRIAQIEDPAERARQADVLVEQMARPEVPFHREFQCTATALVYDFGAHHGTLYIAHEGCTDMGGAIRVFTALDPDVVRIDTRSGSREDTTYLKYSDGTWRAKCVARP